MENEIGWVTVEREKEAEIIWGKENDKAMGNRNE